MNLLLEHSTVLMNAWLAIYFVRRLCLQNGILIVTIHLGWGGVGGGGGGVGGNKTQFCSFVLITG